MSLRFYKSRMVPTALFLLSSLCVSAQTTADRKVKWTAINDKDEFSILIPEGYQSFADGDYSIAGGGRIDQRISIVRLINGVLLRLDRYTGDLEKMQKDLVTRVTTGYEPLQPEHSGQSAGMSSQHYKGVRRGKIWHHQFFRSRKALFAITAVTADENNAISTAFLRSVRLGSGENVEYPNHPAGSDKVNTSRSAELIVEIPPIRDEEPLQGTPDREAVLIIRPRPHQSRPRGISGEVVLRALLSATGTVSKVEVISGPKSLREVSIQAASNVKFIPAEKDGKLVSVWKKFSYSFSSY